MEHLKKRIKILVYGENTLVRRVLSSFVSVSENIDFVGGYHPINCDVRIDHEDFPTQFLILDYEKHSIPNHVFSLCHGLLILLEEMNLEHFNQAELLCNNLIQAKKDLFVSIIDIVQDNLSETETFRISKKIEELINKIQHATDISISFSLVPDTPQVTRAIKDLIQTSKILTIL